MIQSLNLKEKPIVDIVVAVAARGGGENCINMVGKYLVQKGFRVRVVQMIYEGVDWTDESMEFSFCYPTREDHELKDFIDGYAAFLKENGAPDLALATAWPMMSYTAKRAQVEARVSFTVASWLHAPLDMYEASGFGGGDFVKYADIHFAISKEIANAIRLYDKEGIIYRINNPVDLSKVHKVDELCKGTLLFVGRLSEEKNIGIILCAIAVAKSKWKLRLVGDGDERCKLEKLAKELRIEDRVEFVGWCDDPWKYAKDSYALVLSSMYEGSPLVVVEALSCGIPVFGNVSSRVSEIIKPSENGFLYEDNDAEGLSKILDMISDGKLPEICPEKCRESVADYKETISLFDIYCKINATINKRVVRSKVWGISDNPIITDRISVIIPCFNVERYIGRCLDSIVIQTIGVERLMIIVIDDASTDSTRNVIKAYEERYPDNICIVECESNVGPGRARNIGLEYVSGEYVFFADADDCIEPELLESMLIADKLYPSDVVTCDFSVFDEDIPLSEQTEKSSYEYRIIEKDTDRRQLFMDNAMLHPAWGKLIKTEFLREHMDIYFPEGCVMEDIFFTYMLVAYASSWQNLGIKGYHYFQNNSGIMQSEGRKSYYMDVYNTFVLAMDSYKKIGLFDQMVQELGYVYFRKVYKNIIPFVVGTFTKLPMDNIRTVISYMFETFPNISDNVYMDDDDRSELEKAMALFK